MTGCNIQKNKLVCTFSRIVFSKFYRITGFSQVDKVDSFHGLPVFDIQTGYDSFC